MITLIHGKKIQDNDPGLQVNFLEYGIVEIQETILYIDKYGDEWRVPEGVVCDGFSIPRVTWSLVGHPFYARSLIPAVVHDHYCVTKTRSHRRTHKAFHEIMKDVGEKRLRRSVYYSAVRMFGPRWKGK